MTNRTTVHVASGVVEPLSGDRKLQTHYSRNESQVFFIRGMNLWVFSLEDGSERQVTDLVDPSRRGGLARGSIRVTDEYLYFTWGEYVGDIASTCALMRSVLRGPRFTDAS